jgi:hypothetical protein
LSAALLKRKIVVDFMGQKVRSDVWTIILGESGCGKTFATNEIQALTGIGSIPEAASTAAFVEVLAEHNGELWLRDEIGQWLKNLDLQSHMSEMKDVLMRVYDGKEVERKTKKETIRVENPALTILGLTVYSTFLRIINVESLLDGFAQRFSYVVAESDKSRPAVDFPVYDLRPYRDTIRKEWQRIVDELPAEGTTFSVTDDAIEAFKVGFQTLMPPLSDLPMSFYRRIMYRGVRYALLYHMLMHQAGSEISVQDMAWAGRLCALHVKDASKMVFESGGVGGQLGGLVAKAQALKEKMAKDGGEMKARDLISGVWGIKNIGEAKGIMSILD